ncbi:AB hydrolase superfamily protein YdjP [Apiospora rasikravindrae]|uniref:AB hydrolase superfamily protein YdjP n=1 Tax=Apiospora rasikravindrae TaxID=990691 RepID=A0ABR1TCY5_9PEZI
MMQYLSCEANDGCTLAFQSSLPLPAANGPTSPEADPRYCKILLLLHGFSGSSAYFSRNFAQLSRDFWVVALDLRGHGASGRTRGGYHVARLAADVRDLVGHLHRALHATTNPAERGAEPLVVPVGCSIGAAVLWTYVELFGQHGLGGFVFVDQAPLQDRVPGFVGGSGGECGWGADRAHLGCYDEASLLAAQRAWIETPDAAHRGLVEGCLGYRVRPLEGEETGAEYARKKAEDEAFFVGESRRCDGVWLARLLADHTRYDHREAIEGIRVPALVLAGRRTGCFPLEGMEETARRVRKGNGGREEAAEWVVFESGHWLFWEESERFNEVVGGFARKCMA